MALSIRLSNSRFPRLQQCVIASVLFLLAACGSRPAGPTAVIERQGRDPVSVTLEVVRTPAELQKGLMWRTELADFTGMLFVFPAEEEHSFWMKNTLIPLDMIFIARAGPTSGRIAGIHANAVPHSTAPMTVGKPSTWVLEVPGGWCAREGVQAGDAVRFEGVPNP
jgi:uncharacterized protein